MLKVIPVAVKMLWSRNFVDAFHTFPRAVQTNVEQSLGFTTIQDFT